MARSSDEDPPDEDQSGPTDDSEADGEPPGAGDGGEPSDGAADAADTGADASVGGGAPPDDEGSDDPGPIAADDATSDESATAPAGVDDGDANGPDGDEDERAAADPGDRPPRRSATSRIDAASGDGPGDDAAAGRPAVDADEPEAGVEDERSDPGDDRGESPESGAGGAPPGDGSESSGPESEAQTGPTPEDRDGDSASAATRADDASGRERASGGAAVDADPATAGPDTVDVESVGDVEGPRPVDGVLDDGDREPTTDSPTGPESRPAPDERQEASDENADDFAGEEVTPKSAERYAVVGVAGSVGLGIGFAVIGELLKLTRHDVVMLLASGGMALLVLIVFGLFRAMITTVQRDGDSARDAATHPLFMLLFLILATAVALFVGFLA